MDLPKLPKDAFFQKMDDLGIAVTYDDVRLKTGHSRMLPLDVSLESRFSRNIPLKIPLVSAAMDTVTERELAIALAKLGGLGIIHRNLTPDEQAAHVGRVKYHLNGLIKRPVTAFEDQTIESILKKRKEKGYTFHSFPILNCEGKLVGLLTENDFTFCNDTSRTAQEEMSKNLIIAPQGTTLDQAYEIMRREKKKVLPLTSEAGEVVGMYVFSDLKRIKSGSFSHYNLDSYGQLRVGAAVGVGSEAVQRIELLLKENVDVVVIDTAHADSENVLATLREIKTTYPNLDVVVGNISEATSAQRLLDAGADGLKVGQGPGSICTTRVIAGIGCPQVTAVYNCAHVADAYGVPVCADGGIRYSGDIPIALGAGAHSVMLGSVLASTTEAPGEIVFKEGRRWKHYRGMGSLGAMESHKESRERYGQKEVGKEKLIAEGVEGLVPYHGELDDVLFQYIGGLRAGMGYVGAATIEELRQKADFYRISSAGQMESHPHDIKITREPPNYRGGS